MTGIQLRVHPFARAVALQACLWLTAPVLAQEIPEFGTGAANGTVVAPVRERGREQPSPPPPAEKERNQFKVVATGTARDAFEG